MVAARRLSLDFTESPVSTLSRPINTRCGRRAFCNSPERCSDGAHTRHVVRRLSICSTRAPVHHLWTTSGAFRYAVSAGAGPSISHPGHHKILYLVKNGVCAVRPSRSSYRDRARSHQTGAPKRKHNILPRSPRPSQLGAGLSSL